MAKDAARRGDVIEAENYYQHAEELWLKVGDGMNR
jgi:hypothetical protein